MAFSQTLSFSPWSLFPKRGEISPKHPFKVSYPIATSFSSFSTIGMKKKKLGIISFSKKDNFITRKKKEATTMVEHAWGEPLEEIKKRCLQWINKERKKLGFHELKEIDFGNIISKGKNELVKFCLVGISKEDAYVSPQKKEHKPRWSPRSDNRIHSLWIGKLDPSIDEGYLHDIFGEKVRSVKVIRNRRTGRSKGYGFIEFSDHDEAYEVLKTYKIFRMNWARGKGRVRPQPQGPTKPAEI